MDRAKIGELLIHINQRPAPRHLPNLTTGNMSAAIRHSNKDVAGPSLAQSLEIPLGNEWAIIVGDPAEQAAGQPEIGFGVLVGEVVDFLADFDREDGKRGWWWVWRWFVEDVVEHAGAAGERVVPCVEGHVRRMSDLAPAYVDNG